MTTASEAIRNRITPIASGWRVQFAKWVDTAPADRFIVIRPAGGITEALVRAPVFTLAVIGATTDPATVCEAMCDRIKAEMRDNSGGLVYMAAGEPSAFSTEEGRPVFELAVSTIQSL